jgi:uncharacterized RDD family membrane protein YckC
MSTNNFLFNFNIREKDNEFTNYATPMKRSISGIIDCFIVLFLRACFLQFMSNFFVENFLNDFIAEFENKFGTRTPKGTTEHVEFIMNHSIFIYSIIIIFITILIGAIYHAYLNSSQWQATIGKRIAGIMVVGTNGEKISFFTGIFHYFLTLTPIFFVAFIFIYATINKLEIYEIFTKNHILTILGLFFLIASHANSFNKKKINFFDYLMKIEFHLGRTESKTPWTKIDK